VNFRRSIEILAILAPVGVSLSRLKDAIRICIEISTMPVVKSVERLPPSSARLIPVGSLLRLAFRQRERFPGWLHDREALVAAEEELWDPVSRGCVRRLC